MTRSEILEKFRQENPEITTNVATDAVLNSWIETGNLEMCIRARLIRDEATFTTVTGTKEYDLSNEITNFYDIDRFPGGGVVYDGDQLEEKSLAQIFKERPSWLSDSNGTPKDYYRRGQYLVFGKPPSSAVTVRVYCVLLLEALDDDNKSPFNELTYLEPFHYGLVLYLKKRVFMGKTKKSDQAQQAVQEYNDYINWLTHEVNRGIFKGYTLRPKTSYRGTGRTRTRR